MNAQVFISYAAADRPLADALKQELEKLNVSALTVDVMKPTDNWRKTVTDGIRRSQLVAVLWNPNSAASDWVGYEIGSASALGKEIVVIKPSSFSARDLPSDLSGWHTLDLEPSAPARTARILVSSLAAAAK